MLVLTRKLGEEIFIDDEIRIVIKEIKGRQVRIGIEARSSVSVHRGEIHHRIEEENREAALIDLEAADKAAASLKRLIQETG
ncbi:MAG: carbon storage regulator [Nitrospirae bacterium CG_4_9_14_3_um_filter_53_35]|nr:MAG: carbon storage regulator [Nitrospirae bacterium CG2_30_53_67]PIS36453.1 MAG: carbon storage regulator [Nitrospirae bacterium CG08_land_8_20_14_0_20_52_24]PIW85512.1 MAG: carbon storage regulator [Nitrospirae bacterium CG_4_8_14_3_um_filter_50_41]PJA73686.1 MAG: carbon storage regulator [Nitrospirae bacterium CG_4_9_14_3_um_filter_53_35]